MQSREPTENHAGINALAIVTFMSIFGLIGYYFGIDEGSSDLAEIYARAHHENAEKYINETCTNLDGTALYECIKQAIITSGEYRRAEQDLISQMNMSKWAKWLLGLTALSTAISGFAVLYIKKTLDQGVEINAAAVDASNAANDANIIMRAEQRPWVTLRWNVPCEFKVKNSGQSCYLKWEYDFQNMGNTPAFRVKYEWGIFRLDDGIIGVADRGIDQVIEMAKAKLHMSSNTPILFPSEKTDHLASYGSSRIQGMQTGSLYLCTCLTYALDHDGTEFALEARAYRMEPDNSLTSGMTHKILRLSTYDRIQKWVEGVSA